MIRSKDWKLFGLLVLVALVFSACAPAAAPAAAEEAPAAEAPAAAAPAMEEKMIVGLSFSDFATERWPVEDELMTKLLEEKGYEVISQEAAHDVKLQNDQIDNMVTQGAKVIIVIAEDGDAAATAVASAAAAGVKVIAYDRLIKDTGIAAYISFNNTQVGVNEADGVMKALDMDNWDTAGKGPARIIMMGGSPTDNNAILVRNGQMSIVKPYVDAGSAEIVQDQWVDNWDPAKATSLMENMLAAVSNDVDGVVASNDGTALGALTAMKAQGLAGKVPISGQDATADGCNSIVKGEQTVTVFKDTRLLSPLAVELADKLMKGEDLGLEMYTLAELTLDDTLQVQCLANSCLWYK